MLNINNNIFSYINKSSDLNSQNIEQYRNSLIFIGDERQIYIPATNSYVGTAYSLSSKTYISNIANGNMTYFLPVLTGNAPGQYHNVYVAWEIGVNPYTGKFIGGLQGEADYSTYSKVSYQNTIYNTTKNNTYYITFSNKTSGTSPAYINSNLNYNPSTKTLSSTYFSGYLKGWSTYSTYSIYSTYSTYTTYTTYSTYNTYQSIHENNINKNHYISFVDDNTYSLTYIDTYLYYNPYLNALGHGTNISATGEGSHAEGGNTIASAKYSHAEGNTTNASKNNAHAEGYLTEASGETSHAEGIETKAKNKGSHAEGSETVANADYSHAEGIESTTTGKAAHAEGNKTSASGQQSHTEGSETEATGKQSHAEGFSTLASADNSHAEGNESQATNNNAHAEGYKSNAAGKSSHAEGSETDATSDGAHAEGCKTYAGGQYSHAEGYKSETNNKYAHAEGGETTASGESSHAEGRKTTASGKYSHAEGDTTTASGDYSHASGCQTKATGQYSVVSGYKSQANGVTSWAGGNVSITNGTYNFAFGNNIKTSNENEVSFGKYNKTNSDTVFSIGGGTSSTRSNLLEVTTSGLTKSTGGFNKVGYDDNYILLAGGGVKLESNLIVSNADTVDGFHANTLFQSFTGGKISSNGNVLTQENHSIKIGGTTYSAGSSTVNIINSAEWAYVNSLTYTNSTYNLVIRYKVNGIDSSYAYIPKLISYETSYIKQGSDYYQPNTLFTQFDSQSQLTTITIGGTTKQCNIDADTVDSFHANTLFQSFTGGKISSNGNVLTQTNHSIKIGGTTYSAGSSTANIINSAEWAYVNSLTYTNSTYNLVLRYKINGVDSSYAYIPKIYAYSASYLDGKGAKDLFTQFDSQSQLTTITIGGTTKQCNIDADTVDGFHANTLFQSFTGGKISSNGNILTQENHNITIGGTSYSYGYSTANIINNAEWAYVESLAYTNSTYNLVLRYKVNGVDSSYAYIPKLISYETSYIKQGENYYQPNTLFTQFDSQNHSTTITIGGKSRQCDIDAYTLEGYRVTDLDNRYVNVTGDTMTGTLTVKTTGTNKYNQGIRINRTAKNQWALLLIGKSGDATENTGTATAGDGQWVIGTPPSKNSLIFNLNSASESVGLCLKGHGNTDIKWNNKNIWHEGNDGAGSGLDADLIDGYDLDDLLPYGLENICESVSGGGQTILNNDGSISTTGINGDTYYYITCTENLEAGQVYTFGFYVTGIPDNNTNIWEWSIGSQNNSNFTISIQNNGWCWGTGTFENDIPAGSRIVIDDINRNFYNAINLSKFVMVKGRQRAYYTPPISKMEVNHATYSTYSMYNSYQSIFENNINKNYYISFANNTSYSLSYIDSSLYYNPYLNALGHGTNVSATGEGSHAEGGNTTASGKYSHAEGSGSTASGESSHAEGNATTASSTNSHAEGYQTQAISDKSHAEGDRTIASGKQSHAEGTQTKAIGDSSHAEGSKSQTTSKNAHAEGTETLASNEGSHAEGGKTVASGKYSHTEGYQTTASGNYAHAEGRGNTSTPTGASGDYSHSEGNQTISSGESSHAEGEKTTASGKQSHAEGVQTKAEGNYSHAEGYKSTVTSTAEGGHVEGKQNQVEGIYAHAEGLQSFAIGNYSHVEGEKNYARGYASHAGGKATETNGQYSFAFGWGSLTNNDYEASFGKWNKSNSDTIFSIGNGSSNSNRSNLLEVTTSGLTKSSGGFNKVGYDDTYVLLAGGGTKSWGNASGYIPVSNGTVNTNLNADLLDGIHASGLFTKFENSGNNITATIGGTIKTFTVNYATNAGSATKLANERTLWGQLFNGTANVSGNMSSVGNITSADHNTYSIGTNTNKWKEIYATTLYGELSGNASTATKLAASINLWGQSFDGSSDVNGNIYIDTGNNDRFIQFRYNTNNYAGASWRLISRGSGSGDTNYFDIETGGLPESGNTWYRVIRLTMSNRYVGIGVDSPSYKLHVAGDIYTTTGFKKKDSSDFYVLLGGGGHMQFSSSNIGNTLISRDGNGDFGGRHFISDINDENIEIGSVFIRSNIANDNYVRRISFSNFLSKIYSNETTTITKSLKVTEEWMDTGIELNDTNFPNGSGTYAIQVTYEGSDEDMAIYSGIVSICIHEGNSAVAGGHEEEIMLHASGGHDTERIYLKMIQNDSGGISLNVDFITFTTYKLQIATNHPYSVSKNITFKFRKLI